MLVRRFGVAVVPLCVVAVMLQACGGGGGGGDSSGPSGDGQPTATASRTPTAVRTGSPVATRTGSSGASPTPVPVTPSAPTQTPIRPGGNSDDILVALRGAAPGSTVLVAPGTYQALNITASDVQGPVTLLADVTGASESVGGVTISAVDSQNLPTDSAISVTGVTGLTIDGITAQGGTRQAILVQDSLDTTVRNCVVRNSRGDGVFIQSSDGTVLFDNLAYQNKGAGLRVYTSNNIQVFNNTVYGNSKAGIYVGTTAAPSTGVVAENNIIDGNVGVGIAVEDGNDAIGDYNLNTDGYTSDTLIGSHDIDANPLFDSPMTAPATFHLAPQLDDCTNGSPAINAGDPNTSADFIAMLQQRSTQANGMLDCVGTLCCVTASASPTPTIIDLQPGQVDLGYHYPGTPPTPVP